MFDDAAHESCCYLPAGSPNPNPYTSDWRELRDELAHPLTHLTNATVFEVDAGESNFLFYPAAR